MTGYRIAGPQLPSLSVLEGTHSCFQKVPLTITLGTSSACFQMEGAGSKQVSVPGPLLQWDILPAHRLVTAEAGWLRTSLAAQSGCCPGSAGTAVWEALPFSVYQKLREMVYMGLSKDV